MTNSEVVGEPEVSDDSISLTSTILSEDMGSYEVERIVAERKGQGGITEYLTAWKDYPEQAYAWEPRENFNEDEVFDDWKMTQMRVARGIEKPFDMKAWMRRCKAIERETKLRKQRRRNKRSRLSIQNKMTLMPLEQGDNIESSRSKPASRRPDKQIKRRSVHQDLPPSSSLSELSSNPASEDSDRPLIPRRRSESSSTSSKWTQAETIALEQGLRTLRGPRWMELLSLYGRNGTVSQILKDKTPGDLYDKAKSVRQEFVESGREPPEYLKPFSISASSRGSQTATPNIYCQSRGYSRAASKKSSRSTSADSMMAELLEKQRNREAESSESVGPKQIDNLTDDLVSAKRRKKESKIAEDGSSREPKAHKDSEAHARKVEIALTKAIFNEPPKATEPKLHAQDAPSPPKGTTQATESSTDKPMDERRLEPEFSTKGPTRISSSSEAKRQSLISNPKETTESVLKTAVQPKSSNTDVPESSEATHEQTARTTWSGTARAPRSPVSKSPRQGIVGNGPTRTTSLKLKPTLGQIEPKKTSVASDVTAAWNAEPKRRKSNNWATSNADPVNGQEGKHSYKLSVQNRIYKSRREGRAPNPNALIFIDPKTGKVPTSLPAPSPTATVSRTPLQLYHEELARREAEERQAQEIEETMHRSTKSKDQNRDNRGDKQGVSESDRMITDGPPHKDNPTFPPSASSHPGLPSNTPKGPKLDREKVAMTSLQDFLSRSTLSTKSVTDASINSHRPASFDDPSSFTLRSHPSQEHKHELFKVHDSNVVIGDIMLRKDDEDTMHVKLIGFSFEIKKLILTIKSPPRTVNFLFESVCHASEYQAYFPAQHSDYLGQGSIIPYPESALAFEDVTETLANNVQGALFFAQQYTMLMYPAGASAWGFLDNVSNVHPGTSLRFVVRKPLPPSSPDVQNVAIAQFARNNPKRYAEIAAKVSQRPVQAEEKNINIVFRDMFEIDFGRLVAQNGPQTHPPTKIFFLFFIPQGCEDYEPDPAKRFALRMRTSEEHDLFIDFLQANGAEEIYSLQNIGSQEVENNGAWDYFLKKVKSGSIIFHNAFTRYDLVPRLAKHLLHGSVNVWETSLSPMHHGEKHTHLVRLFPHGGVLLMTESLVLYRPLETLRMLMWFRRIHIPGKAPGTWKLAVRPRVREWLLDIMDAYADSGKDVFGTSMQTFAAIYTEIYWLLQSPHPGDNGLLCYEWDYETPTEEAPIVSSSSLRVLQGRKEWKGEGGDREPDDDNIRQNDDLLIQWFAEFAIVNVHKFRKFHVILGYPKDHPFTEKAIPAYEQAWGHIEVMAYEEALTRHKVTAQSKLDEMEAARRKKLKAELPAKRAVAIKGRKEERAAAKMALAARMQCYRDSGATKEDVIRAGRQLLRDLGGSEKEIMECRVDMDRVFVDRWWEGSATDRDVNMEGSGTIETGLK